MKRLQSTASGLVFSITEELPRKREIGGVGWGWEGRRTVGLNSREERKKERKKTKHVERGKNQRIKFPIKSHLSPLG